MQFVLFIEQFLRYFVLHIEHIFNRKGKYFFQNKQILKILFLKNTTKKYYTSTKKHNKKTFRKIFRLNLQLLTAPLLLPCFRGTDERKATGRRPKVGNDKSKKLRLSERNEVYFDF